MVTFEITGRVTEDGRLEFDAPRNLPAGQAHITIEVSPDDIAVIDNDLTMTPEEVAELLRPVPPMSGKEIVESGLLAGPEDPTFPDGLTWVQEQRRKRHERYQR